MLYSQLHCQKGLNLTLFSHEIVRRKAVLLRASVEAEDGDLDQLIAKVDATSKRLLLFPWRILSSLSALLLSPELSDTKVCEP